MVGTYRAISSLFSERFYSETEFTLNNFLKSPGIKLEFGRACLHPEFRKSNALSLIWKGLGKYIKLTNAEYLFGCSSVFTSNPVLIDQILEKLDSLYEQNTFAIKSKSLMPVREVDFTSVENPASFVPTLLKSYLKAGAKIYGEPSFDNEFQCFDLLTILKVNEMSEKYKKKYLGDS